MNVHGMNASSQQYSLSTRADCLLWSCPLLLAATRADNGRPHWYLLTGDFNVNGVVQEMDYRLPAGFSCPNGCVLQM
jgi:hypothetical protein